MADPQDAQQDDPHSLRITFAYDGPNLRVARVQRVAMLAPGVATAPPQGEQSGYWLEVRDAGGRLLYHRPVHDPLRERVESYGQGPDDPMRRHSTPGGQGEFQVIIPDLPGAQTFRLHGPPEQAAAAAHPARKLRTPSTDLCEYTIDDLRRRAGEGSGR